jgi:hypothetical protein
MYVQLLVEVRVMDRVVMDKLCRRKLFIAAVAALFSMRGFALAQADSPVNKAPNSSGLHHPGGHTGTISTDSTIGSPPSSPEGETPSDMQAKPKGEDKRETK